MDTRGQVLGGAVVILLLSGLAKGQEKPEAAKPAMSHGANAAENQAQADAPSTVVLLCPTVRLLETVRAELPDTPEAKQGANVPGQKQGKIAGQGPLRIIARRSFFYPELATSPGPLSAKEKFELFLTRGGGCRNQPGERLALRIWPGKRRLRIEVRFLDGDGSFEPFFRNVSAAIDAEAGSAVLRERHRQFCTACGICAAADGLDTQRFWKRSFQLVWTSGPAGGGGTGEHVSSRGGADVGKNISALWDSRGLRGRQQFAEGILADNFQEPGDEKDRSGFGTGSCDSGQPAEAPVSAREGSRGLKVACSLRTSAECSLSTQYREKVAR